MGGVSGTGMGVRSTKPIREENAVIMASCLIRAFRDVPYTDRQNNSRSDANTFAVGIDSAAGNTNGVSCDRRELRTFAVDDFTSNTSVFQKSDTMDLLRNMIMSQVPKRDDYSPHAHFGGQLIKELARSTKFDFLKELVKKLDQGSPEDRELVGHLLKAIAAEANQDHKSAIEALKPTQGK